MCVLRIYVHICTYICVCTYVSDTYVHGAQNAKLTVTDRHMHAYIRTHIRTFVCKHTCILYLQYVKLVQTANSM